MLGADKTRSELRKAARLPKASKETATHLCLAKLYIGQASLKVV
jgi:hypothetical protein